MGESGDILQFKWIALNLYSEGKQIRANSLWSAHNNTFDAHHGQHVTHFSPRASDQRCSLLRNQAWQAGDIH